MLPQAPFEPTYRIWNFNTMPLYPILIGIGRWFGIDGSFALKFWPLSAWAASGALLGVSLYRARLPAALALLFCLGFSIHPALRWASVLVRPESLIGLAAIALVLGLTLGFPRRLRPQGFWDPVAGLLAVAAYAHFNAIHLIFPVFAAFYRRPRRLLEIGAKTALYLAPWAMTILWHPGLFVHQMKLQWTRLAVGNSWLKNYPSAIESLFQSMGSPEPWPPLVHDAARIIWLLIFASLGAALWTVLGSGLIQPIFRSPRGITKKGLEIHHTLNLAPAGAWVAGAIWLWHSKPEVWFTYYLHAAVWCFAALAALKAWQEMHSPRRNNVSYALASGGLAVTVGAACILLGIFFSVNLTQAAKLNQGASWRWSTYDALIDCVDRRLTTHRAKIGAEREYRVWDPTFPDITIELSRRHPDWEFSRTNDFWERVPFALQHGHEVEAVVVPESLTHEERNIDGPASDHPEVRSVWMNWNGYFLKRLGDDPKWIRDRYICQAGKWQAFIYLKLVP